MNLPIDFTERMRGQLGEETQPFLRSYEQEPRPGLRINTLKVEKEAFLSSCSFQLEPVPWVEWGYYYNPKERPGKHAWHDAGLYYIQEPSAMAVAELTAPKPGERVLDLCAAPGGKTTQLAALMKNQGLLVSNEIHPARAKILSQNVERMGITNTVVTNEPPDKLARHFPGFFHRIVVDAPCSGEGMFRKDPETCSEWSLENVAMCSDRQLLILDQIKGCLRPGGRLVYSTCTFSEEENEQVIRRFLRENPDFELESVDAYEGFHAVMEGAFRLWPHRLQGEGHFLAVLRRIQNGENAPRERFSLQKGLRGKGVLKEYGIFAEKTLGAHWQAAGSLVLFGENLYSVPETMVSMDKMKVVRPGLHLGTMKKNRFEPSHALALALTPQDARQVHHLHGMEPQTIAYLKGETLQNENVKNGWVLVAVDGYSLGWAKSTDGILKNHYPKGLRWL